MTRDRALQKIVDKAHRQNAQLATAQVRQQDQRLEKPPSSELTFADYWRMDASGPGLLWWAPLAFLMLLPFVETPWFRYPFLGYLAVFGVRLVIYAITLVRGYRVFRTFPRDLKLALTGWQELVGDAEMMDDGELWYS